MLYFAYGSNLNKANMRRRCPRALPVGRFMLDDARLVFRGVADCIYEPGATCPGALWRITEECEHALDCYEGWPRLYRKEYVPVTKFGGETTIMLYVMNSTGIMPPSQGYLDTIRQGYRDFGMKQAPLDAAVKASWDDKAPSHVERQRHRRKGRPVLARPAPGRLPVPAPRNLGGWLHDVRPVPPSPSSWLLRNGMVVHSED